MKHIALAVLALASLTTGCAGMGTKRSGGAQIQRPQSADSTWAQSGGDLGDLGPARRELGER